MKKPQAKGARGDTAIFYSISNCQNGLRGVSFGNFLIKQVVEELKTELPQLKRFCNPFAGPRIPALARSTARERRRSRCHAVAATRERGLVE